jgi:hypothetical protein
VSRIRSVHPGLHTDERFVSVQPFARLLFIGLWNECDDQGLFEWSPLKLKMRLLPADNVDAAQLLDELAAGGMVYPYEVDGRRFGAVRNFGKWQRPKKPNAIYPGSELALAFATSGSPPVPHQFGTDGEKSPQREEEGGRSSSEASASGAAAPPAPPPAGPIDLKAAVFGSGVALLVKLGTEERNARSMLGRWRRDHGDGAVLDALSAAQAESPSDPIAWLTRTLGARNGKRPSYDRPSAWGPGDLPLGAAAASLDEE